MLGNVSRSKIICKAKLAGKITVDNILEGRVKVIDFKETYQKARIFLYDEIQFINRRQDKSYVLNQLLEIFCEVYTSTVLDDGRIIAKQIGYECYEVKPKPFLDYKKGDPVWSL